MGTQWDSQNTGDKLQAETVHFIFKYTVLCALYRFCKMIPFLAELP